MGFERVPIKTNFNFSFKFTYLEYIFNKKLTFLITYKGTSKASRFVKDSITHFLLISVPKFEVIDGQ